MLRKNEKSKMISVRYTLFLDSCYRMVERTEWVSGSVIRTTPASADSLDNLGRVSSRPWAMAEG